jgi:hypothetical protein
MASEGEEFDPARPPTWRGSRHDLVLNPVGRNTMPNARSRGRKSDPSAWRQTPEAQAKYREARAYAQSKANEMGMDMGLEGNDVFKHWNVFGPLPKRENRSGHELRCEVVSPENIGSTQRGHGHAPNQRSRRFSRNSGSTRLHAQPYQDAAGFYFGSTEEFEAGMAKLNKRGIEEVELQFIDGSKGDAELFAALNLSQINVALWFDSIEGLEDYQKATLFYMATNGWLHGKEPDELVEQIADGQLDEMANQGTLKELVEQWMDDDIIGGEQFVNYFDYDAFGHDLQVSGDLCGNEEDDEAREACEARWEGKSDYDIGYEWLDEVYGGVEEWWTQIQKQKKEAGYIGHGSNSREERRAQEAEDNFKHFFNIDGFVRDVEINGDVNEFQWNGETWTIQRS